LTSSAPIAEHPPPTPPKAVVLPSNSPGLLRVDGIGSEYSHGTSASQDISESPDHAGAIGRTTVTEPSLPQPTPVLSSPTNNDVREASSNSNLVVSRFGDRGHPEAERSHDGNRNDVTPPPAYAPAVTPSVAEEGPSANTGRERERVSPRTSPSAPIRTHQSERLDPIQPSLSLTPSMSIPSTHTHRSSNAAPTPAAQSTQWRAEIASPSAPVETAPQHGNVININIYASNFPNGGASSC
jgi:hypothetical protein